MHKDKIGRCWYLSVSEKERKGSISAHDIHGFLVSASPIIANISVLGKIENHIVNCK